MLSSHSEGTYFFALCKCQKRSRLSIYTSRHNVWTVFHETYQHSGWASAMFRVLESPPNSTESAAPSVACNVWLDNCQSLQPKLCTYGTGLTPYVEEMQGRKCMGTPTMLVSHKSEMEARGCLEDKKIRPPVHEWYGREAGRVQKKNGCQIARGSGSLQSSLRFGNSLPSPSPD
ncbi:hypothetical protein AC579_8754 [Pseudocercospora musae]|uniref:Uncharacterized protein n=1 Tax=Pseudocercospora musae TaxID=113226 RepID=A0A139IW62_9PEZI|nr:hypothetical protein AC579_8754 [Pseudocercospora musae]